MSGEALPRPTALSNIDAPTSLVVAGLPFDLVGWAAAADPIGEIAVLVDDVPVGPAELGHERQDVARAFPHLAEAGRSGFRRNRITLPAGGHASAELRVIGKTRSGEEFESRRTVRILASEQDIVDFARTSDSYSASLMTDCVRLLLGTERPESAEIFAAEAAERFPESVDALELVAMAAMGVAERSSPDLRSQTYHKARGLWGRLRERDPSRFASYAGEARACIMLNAFGEAETVAAKAVELFPGEPEGFFLWADIAAHRRDWAEAIRRWRAGQERFPGNEGFTLGEKRTRYEAGEETPAFPPSDAPDLDDRDLMMQFEGMGCNCDFGMVQRDCGAEPLGLLRFAAVPFDCLLQGLATRFEGVGKPENTVFSVRPHPRPEYWVGDTRLDLLMHTFIYPEDVSPEQERQLFDKQCKRLAFLAGKLVGDLESAEKIFVYQLHEMLTEEQMRRLFAAVRDYGDNILLCVGPSDDSHPAGTVERLDDGLLVGRVKSFTHFGQSLDRDHWRKVCRAAYRLARN